MVRIIDARHSARAVAERLLQWVSPGLREAWLRRSVQRRVPRARRVINEIIAGIAARGGSFDRVEIETVNRCNNTCAFCPVNRRDDPRPPARMPDALFERILGMLRDSRFAGGFALFSNNEPLLDPRLEDLAARARAALPGAYHYLYTNGTLLTVGRFERLVPSLDHLIINNYDDAGRLLPTVREVSVYARTHCPSANIDIVLRRTDELLTTRAGTAPNRATITPLPVCCFLPFGQLIVRPDGKISQCCDDALGRVTLGDLSSQSLGEAWNSPQRRALQARIREGRAADPLCRGCDTLDTDDRG